MSILGSIHCDLVELIGRCIHQLLLLSEEKLKKKRRLILFSTIQEYTRLRIEKNNFPMWVRDRIYSDSILISLLYCPFFYPNQIELPISSFRPLRSYGIGMKYVCTLEAVLDFLMGKRDTWFIGISSYWKNAIIQQMSFHNKHLLRCSLKKIAWKLSLPDDVKLYICDFSFR